jgi:SAM-dependent methyltransferase
LRVTVEQVPSEVEAGQAVYHPLVLAFYDWWVLGVSNRFAWRCPSPLLLEQYNRLAGPRHLDIGVGTGWFLDRTTWRGAKPEITLLDLNPSSLAAASKRIGRYTPATVRANVLEPLPLGAARFDSVGSNFLLHCVPGTIEEKAGALVRNAKPFLEPGGVLFGSTILGRGVRHNTFGKGLMAAYNRKGIFHNREDDAAELERALAAELRAFEVKVIGCVALFSARA